MKANLYEIPMDWPLVWQWWADIYPAGFASKDRAHWYGRLHGWMA